MTAVLIILTMIRFSMGVCNICPVVSEPESACPTSSAEAKASLLAGSTWASLVVEVGCNWWSLMKGGRASSTRYRRGRAQRRPPQRSGTGRVEVVSSSSAVVGSSCRR